MTNLPVAYKSQWDKDATLTANDCGPTSIAMVINFLLGQNLTTDKVFQLTGAGKGLISISQMQTAVAALGLTAGYETNCTPARLKQLLDQGLPVIALVHYGSLQSVQDKNFKGGHFFVVVGYRDDGYFVNDPNFQDKFRQDGDHHFYTTAEFEKAWADCSIDKNPIRSLIIIQKPVVLTGLIDQHRNVVIMPDEGANVRNQPQSDGKNITNVLKKGTTIAVDGFLRGQVIDGNPYWWKVKDANQFVWSGVTSVIPTEAQAAAANPTPPAPLTPDSGRSIEQLTADLETQKQLTQKVIAESQQKDIAYANLEKERDEFMNKYNTVEDTAREIEGYKHTNEELISQNKEQEIAYQQKIGELKGKLANARVDAFAGWELLEIPAGKSALSQVPALVLKLTALLADIMKNGYVVGWKRGGKLVKVEAAKPTGPLQPVSELLQ